MNLFRMIWPSIDSYLIGHPNPMDGFPDGTRGSWSLDEQFRFAFLLIAAAFLIPAAIFVLGFTGRCFTTIASSLRRRLHSKANTSC